MLVRAGHVCKWQNLVVGLGEENKHEAWISWKKCYVSFFVAIRWYENAMFTAITLVCWRIKL